MLRFRRLSKQGLPHESPLPSESMSHGVTVSAESSYWPKVLDRKHLTLGNKPILTTFSGLLSGPGFSRLAC